MRVPRAATAAAAVVVAALGGGVLLAQQDPAPGPPRPACAVRGELPDPACTPGVVLTGVTEAEVCVPGWSAAHRNVPARVRREVLASYGGAPAGAYELDHLVSLELGGTNDPANLWPQAGRIPNPKDRVENRLHRLVCAGRVDLADAQQRIAADWTHALDGLQER